LNIPRRLLLGGALLTTIVSVRPAAAQTQVGGVVYSQYAYQMRADTNGVHQNAFDVTRAYLNFTRKFDGGIATRITGDVYRASDGSINYRLKYAYFTWTPKNSPVDFRFGQTQTPLLDWEEGLWGYRLQGTMPMERAGFQTSSDLGLGIDGAWAKDKFDVQASIMNGEGYHGAEGAQYKDVGLRASLRLLESDEAGSRGGLRVTVLGEAGRNNNDGNRNRIWGMLSYKSKVFLLAGEIGSVTNSADSASADVKSRVFAVYGTLTPKDSKVGIVARIDNVDPNTNSAATNDVTTRFIGGISYKLSPNVLLFLNVDNVSFQGTPSANTKAANSTLYFQTQFTF
jgi:hypothetical protein